MSAPSRWQGICCPQIIHPPGLFCSHEFQQLASPLLLLMGAGALVLLVSSVNVANLQLARTEARRLELAVHAALGTGSSTIAD